MKRLCLLCSNTISFGFITWFDVKRVVDNIIHEQLRFRGHTVVLVPVFSWAFTTLILKAVTLSFPSIICAINMLYIYIVGGHWPLWQGWKTEWPRRTDKSRTLKNKKQKTQTTKENPIELELLFEAANQTLKWDCVIICVTRIDTITSNIKTLLKNLFFSWQFWFVHYPLVLPSIINVYRKKCIYKAIVPLVY